jgi:hypothetical protein
MIPNTPILCNNIMSRSSLDIKDAHSQKIGKIKKEIEALPKDQILAATKSNSVNI